ALRETRKIGVRNKTPFGGLLSRAAEKNVAKQISASGDAPSEELPKGKFNKACSGSKMFVITWA
ncbi:MAG: hypothetical protein ACK4I8_11960, partial [Armatimonadota bacterium]